MRAANPHADRLGNANVWHFYAEPVLAQAVGTVIPRRVAAREMAGG